MFCGGGGGAVGGCDGGVAELRPMMKKMARVSDGNVLFWLVVVGRRVGGGDASVGWGEWAAHFLLG